MKQCMDADNLHRRLKKIIGQVQAIDRMVDVFPEGLQRQIRMQVSTCLHAVLSQQLVRRRGGGRGHTGSGSIRSRRSNTPFS